MKLGQNFVKYFVRFLVNGVKKNGFEIYWPLGSIMAEWILQIDWRIEKCKADFFCRWFWKPETRCFWALQCVIMKCLLCALYWTRCKSPSVKKKLKDSLLDNSNIMIGFWSIFMNFCYKFPNSLFIAGAKTGCYSKKISNLTLRISKRI